MSQVEAVKMLVQHPLVSGKLLPPDCGALTNLNGEAVDWFYLPEKGSEQ